MGTLNCGNSLVASRSQFFPQIGPRSCFYKAIALWVENSTRGGVERRHAALRTGAGEGNTQERQSEEQAAMTSRCVGSNHMASRSGDRPASIFLERVGVAYHHLPRA